jgi:hypothetical protein
MSNSGTGYLLGSFRFSSASDSGHQDNNGWGGYGFLAHIIHDGSSAPLPHPPPIYMREGEGGRPRPARGAVRTRCVLMQYGEGPRGEPAGRRLVAAADRRLQQKRSLIMRAWVIFVRRLYVSFRHGAIKPAALVPIMG